jgi:hypothetical protein
MPPMSMLQPKMELRPRERLLAHSAAFLKWLDCPEARLFSEWLADVRLRENKKLMESKDTVDVYRAQGSVGVIDLISGLKDDLRDYEKDVISGKIRPLKEG